MSSRCIKASFNIPENRLNFSTLKGFRMKISMKLVYQYMAIFCTFLHPLQVENCDSNSRLVVDKDDNGKFRLERVKKQYLLFSGKLKCQQPVTIIMEFSKPLCTDIPN